MPPKRKNQTDEPTGRDKKKQKIAAARTIAVQSTPAAESSTNVRVDSAYSLASRNDKIDDLWIDRHEGLTWCDRC
jgi:hypothetical protein